MDEQKTLRQAKRLIAAAEYTKAQRLLNSLLQQAPSADVWVLMAATMESDEKRVKCLQYALQLDPWHSEANRQLSAVQPVSDLPNLATDDQPSLATLVEHPEANSKHKKFVRYRQRRFGCLLFFLLLSSISSFIALSMVGIIPGGITIITQLRGGPGPVTSINNQLIADVPDAILQIDPALKERLSGERVEIIDHGYTHEYTFEAQAGDEFEGYVQFMSVNARDVTNNVVILNPDGRPAPEDTCFFRGEEGLLGGRANANFNCRIDQSGIWAVRILGLRDESIGTYFISVQKLNG